MKRPRTRLLVTAACVAVALAAALGWRWMASRPVHAPGGEELGRLAGAGVDDLNLLLVTLDTTRADRIGAYGFKGVETPTLDRLAREGVLFERAISPAPLTLPAHSSIFTGKLPPRHGVRDNGGFFLDAGETTLAERLKARGFKTGGFVGAYVLDSKWGVDQGFDTYFDDFDLTKYQSLSLGSVDRAANEVADHALQWLDSVAGSRFFGWVHFYDAHSTYAPPEPFKTRYANRPYAGEIAFVDSQLSRIVTWLESRSLLERTVIVVLGDHGESLGEHGESTHGFFVYEGVTHIPFIIRAPYDRMHGRRVSDVVRSVDVMPTVLDLLGVRGDDRDRHDGASLVPLLTGARAELGLEAYSEAVYPQFHFGWSELRSLQTGRFKYIAAPRPELYDLQEDPREEKNLFAERGALAARMAERLDALGAAAAAERPPTAATEVDPDARERLAALGYIGTFTTTRTADPAKLADPKDKIHLFNLMTRAREMAKHDPEGTGAIEALQRITGEDPNVIDAWFMLGNEYYRRREFTRAIENYRHALALKPDYDLALINMANSYRALGRDEEAMLGYRRFMEIDPRNAHIRYETAQILIDNGKLAEARQELERALEIEPKLAAARNALGVVALRLGDEARAEREIQAAIAEKPDVRLAHFNLALLAEQRGDFNTALAEYRREIEIHPQSFRAHFNMGKVYEALGNRAAQIEAYRAAIDANPEFAEGHLFLAKLYLDANTHLEEAIELARKGVQLAPDSEYAPLGHYVIADIYNRLGQRELAQREAAIGRRLEQRDRRPRGN
jgi:choline-sulfatase